MFVRTITRTNIKNSNWLAMKLSKDAVEKIAEDLTLRQKIGIAIKKTDDWILRLARQNKPNGPLTTVKAVQVIREETKLTDQQILVDEENQVPAISK
jgi:hypothetical protein